MEGVATTKVTFGYWRFGAAEAWHSALGPRPCPACWALRGTVHKLDEQQDDDVRHARSLRDILGETEARKWQQSSNILKSVGADVNNLALLQETRLKELHGLTTGQIDTLIQKMTNATELPRLTYHFQRHGELLGTSTEEEYLALFRSHIRRADLRIATALRPKDQVPMWYLRGYAF